MNAHAEPAATPVRVNVSSKVLDQHQSPLLTALRDAHSSDMIPFSTPGHKLGAGADPELVAALGVEMFTHDVWLNTAVLSDTLQSAEALAADAWGADRTCVLVNGSSSGNHAFLLATLSHG